MTKFLYAKRQHIRMWITLRWGTYWLNNELTFISIVIISIFAQIFKEK